MVSVTKAGFTESIVEDAALEWLKGLGYAIQHGPQMAVGSLIARNQFLHRMQAGPIFGTEAK